MKDQKNFTFNLQCLVLQSHAYKPLKYGFAEPCLQTTKVWICHIPSDKQKLWGCSLLWYICKISDHSTECLPPTNSPMLKIMYGLGNLIWCDKSLFCQWNFLFDIIIILSVLWKVTFVKTTECLIERSSWNMHDITTKTSVIIVCNCPFGIEIKENWNLSVCKPSKNQSGWVLFSFYCRPLTSWLSLIIYKKKKKKELAVCH